MAGMRHSVRADARRHLDLVLIALTALAALLAAWGWVQTDDGFTRLAMAGGVLGVVVAVRDLRREP
jgi:hypothetical protein